MPIRKFSSIEEMKAHKLEKLTGDELVRQIEHVWTRAAALSPVRPPRGVMKFRSIEEANACRDQWEKEQIVALRTSRRTN
jgi:hypothetical protein